MKDEMTYLSSDGVTTIHATVWLPKSRPKAILQIAHGMVEFIERYDRFGRLMADHGYLVAGNDHLGHGRSVIDEEHFGYFAEPDGHEAVLMDLRKLTELLKRRFPGIPLVFMGHSMGSYFAREYFQRWGKDLAGGIVMGTSHQPAPVIRFGQLLCSVTGQTKGQMYRSLRIEKLALGSNNKAFEPARTNRDWLTRDEAIVDAYVSNPWDTYHFTVNGFQGMFTSIVGAVSAKKNRRIPKELPILFISGAMDPVGNFGRGPKAAAAQLRKLGLGDVTLEIIPGDRHEVLNEIDHEKADGIILSWLEQRVKA